MSIAVASYPKMPEMPYAEARPLIRSGDILFCSGSHILSKMIQKGTQSVWSHVGFILRCHDIDRVMLLESVESGGVRTVPLSHYDHNYKGAGKPYPGRVYIARHREFEKRANPQRLYQMTQFVVDLFGYPYDRDEILRITARIGMGLFGFSKSDVRTGSTSVRNTPGSASNPSASGFRTIPRGSLPPPLSPGTSTWKESPGLSRPGKGGGRMTMTCGTRDDSTAVAAGSARGSTWKGTVMLAVLGGLFLGGCENLRGLYRVDTILYGSEDEQNKAEGEFVKDGEKQEKKGQDHYEPINLDNYKFRSDTSGSTAYQMAVDNPETETGCRQSSCSYQIGSARSTWEISVPTRPSSTWDSAA
jgi:hypothetical protein